MKRLLLAGFALFAGAVLLTSDEQALAFNSLGFASAVVLTALPLAALVARLLHCSLPSWQKSLLWGACWGSLMAPIYLHAAAWICLAGIGGLFPRWLGVPTLLSGWTGAVWVHAMCVTPLLALSLHMYLQLLPRRVQELLALECANWRQRFLVNARLLAPGGLVAVMWSAIVVNSDMTAADLFRVRTLTEVVYAELAATSDATGKTFTVASAMLLLAALLGIAWQIASAASVLLSSGWHAATGRPRKATQLDSVLALGLTLWLCIPLLGLAYRAGSLGLKDAAGVWRMAWSWQELVNNVIASPQRFHRELATSMELAIAASFCALSIAIACTWFYRDNRAISLLVRMLAVIGFATPGPVIAWGVIRCLNQPFPLMSWFYDNTLVAPVASSTLRLLPYAWLGCEFLWATLPRGLLETAKLDGLSTWKQLIRVVLPIRKNSLLLLSGLLGVLAAGDVAASILTLPPGVSTVAFRVFDRLHTGTDQQIAGFCLLLWLAAIVLCAAVVHYLGRSKAKR